MREAGPSVLVVRLGVRKGKICSKSDRRLNLEALLSCSRKKHRNIAKKEGAGAKRLEGEGRYVQPRLKGACPVNRRFGRKLLVPLPGIEFDTLRPESS